MAKNEVQIYQEQGSEILAEAKALEVTNKVEYDIGIAYERAADDLGKAIVEHHKDMKQKAHEAHKAVVAAEKKLLNPVREARRIIKGKTTKWYVDEERKREAAARKAAEEAQERKLDEAEKLEAQGDHEAAEVLLNAPEPIVQAEEIETPVHYRDNWKARVVETKLVPKEYWMINEALLDQVAKKSKGSAEIPGVEFYNDRIQVG